MPGSESLRTYVFRMETLRSRTVAEATDRTVRPGMISLFILKIGEAKDERLEGNQVGLHALYVEHLFLTTSIRSDKDQVGDI